MKKDIFLISNSTTAFVFSRSASGAVDFEKEIDASELDSLTAELGTEYEYSFEEPFLSHELCSAHYLQMDRSELKLSGKAFLCSSPDSETAELLRNLSLLCLYRLFLKKRFFYDACRILSKVSGSSELRHLYRYFSDESAELMLNLVSLSSFSDSDENSSLQRFLSITPEKDKTKRRENLRRSFDEALKKDGLELQVVGMNHYEWFFDFVENLEKASEMKKAESILEGKPFDATENLHRFWESRELKLIPEPENRYDPNAVAVHLKTDEDFRKIGYLRRTIAAIFAEMKVDFLNASAEIRKIETSDEISFDSGLSLKILANSKFRLT